MLNALNFGTPIRLLSLTADPALPENGLMFYNSASHKYIAYKNGGFDYFAMGSDLDAVTASTDDINLLIGAGFPITVEETQSVSTQTIMSFNSQTTKYAYKIVTSACVSP